MCGIAGSLDLRARRSDEEMVASMTDLLSYRGPDDAGLLVDPPVTLGHRRLSILDLSPGGHQPMAGADGRLWITFNGEIYNYKELAVELRALGHVFRSSSDTEVLLAAYERWGVKALERLNGMFAFAIWDRARKELFCARDRFGVKPFYYTTVEGRFRFASEIKALLLDPAVVRVANEARVLDFLAYGYTDHTAETLFDGVLQLPPGSSLLVRTGLDAPEPEGWYEPRPVDLRGEPAAKALRERLVDAVALRLRSDVPVGTTLSGGLDSSSVTAIATMLRRAEGLDPAPTYSARAIDPLIDEGRYIAPMLERTGAPNRAFTPKEADLLDHLDHVLWHQDEPFHSAAVYGNWKLSELARTGGVTVILDGQGGDEALAGYEHLLYPGFFWTLLRRGKLRRALAEARRRRQLQGAPLVQSLKELVKLAFPARVRAAAAPAWLRPSAAGRLMRPPLPGPTLLEHHLYGLMVQPLPMYNHQLDRNTMSVSLEARNPFLDYRVVECGLALRPEEHVRGGYTKWTLREAVRDLLPSEVVDRPKKQGFSTDESAWMRGGLGDVMLATFSSSTLDERPFLDRDKLLALLDRHRKGANHSTELWRAFIVERWHHLFIDPDVLGPPARHASTPTTSHTARGATVRIVDDVVFDHAGGEAALVARDASRPLDRTT
ncbi:MAG: asparagine synthase (glutamine-hydrolyzing) [Actinomycetota bacterium]